MQYVKLGNTGVDVSRICLGCMSFGKPGKENGVFPWAKDYDGAKPIFKKAVDLGSAIVNEVKDTIHRDDEE